MCASVRYRPPETAEIGIFGGTGNYDPSYLQDAKQFKVYTPYGPPSDLVTVGWVKDRKGAEARQAPHNTALQGQLQGQRLGL